MTSAGPGMNDEVRRGAATVLAPLVASLRAWGVRDADWRPAPDGVPVLYLRTGSEFERVHLQAQPWFAAQLRLLLLRVGVPPEEVDRIRTQVVSTETHPTAPDP